MSQSVVELSVGGMTCASCSRRVERAINKIPGASASVNYATGEATVELEQPVDPQSLVAAIEGVGYSAAIRGKAIEPFGLPEFQKRFVVSAGIAVGLMAISMVPNFQFSGWQFVSAALATPVVVWGAYPFHRATIINARHKAITMDTLVSLGVSIAFLWSLWALVFTNAGDVGMHMHAHFLMPNESRGEPQIFFDVASGITALILLGKVLEHRARHNSLKALEQLASLTPRQVVVIRDGQHVMVPIEEVVVGDYIHVPLGSTVPVDGVVVGGQGYLDKSLVTGESLPIKTDVGQAVVGGTVLVDGVLTVEATAIGRDTVLSHISRMVHQAQATKSEVTKLVDRVSEVFVPVVVALAGATVIGWLLVGRGVTFAMSVGITVLVIACPCALGLATPTALLVGTGRAAQLGILIRGAHALEASEKLEIAFLDKTGTVTQGKMTVVAVQSEIPDSHLWNVVAGLERSSTHPIAQSLLQFARDSASVTLTISDLKSESGIGVSGMIDNQYWQITSANEMSSATPSIQESVTTFKAHGYVTVGVYCNHQMVAAIALADSVAQSSKQAIKDLQSEGIEPVLLSGDHEQVVANVAKDLGIKTWFSSATPSDKLTRVTQASDAGQVVAMIGDGVNDAAALAKAHLSIAMGSGADIATSSADIVLMRPSMEAAVDAIQLSRATMRMIRVNLFWAFAYNVAAIPLAMSGLLGPLVGAGAMAFSSVFVVNNSLRLRNFQPH